MITLMPETIIGILIGFAVAICLALSARWLLASPPRKQIDTPEYSALSWCYARDEISFEVFLISAIWLVEHDRVAALEPSRPRRIVTIARDMSESFEQMDREFARAFYGIYSALRSFTVKKEKLPPHKPPPTPSHLERLTHGPRHRHHWLAAPHTNLCLCDCGARARWWEVPQDEEPFSLGRYITTTPARPDPGEPERWG